MVGVLLFVLILLVLVVLLALAAIYFRLQQPARDNPQAEILSEKLSQLAPVAHTVSDIQANLAGLQAHIEARRELEQRTADSVRRLEAVIAGTQSKGAAGENILESVFSRLPVQWQIRDFKVGNKTVEFGLRLPNNLVLPVDSKWTATSLVERFAVCDDVDEQRQLKRQIEAAVRAKAGEVTKYIDPNTTTGFGLAVIPDAVYDVCGGMHADIFKMNVVVVGHSMFVPYLLLVFQTTLKNSQSVDLQKLDAYLQSVERGIESLQAELDGRFSRAMVMLNNSRSEMSGQLSKVGSGVNNLRLSAASSSTELGDEARHSLTS